jgi:hypothetical protein
MTPALRASIRPGLLLALLLVTACGADVVTEAYATRAEAEQAGAFARGWIPHGIPSSAHDLREAHDLDTSQRWGLFDFNPADGAELRAMLDPAEVSLSGTRTGIPQRIEWWPVMLRTALDDAQLKTAGLKAYRSTDRKLIVIVNWAQGRAYYWSL